MFELNKDNMKAIIKIVTYACLLLFVLFNFSGAVTVVNVLFTVFSPIIFGLIFAFLINILMNKIEGKLKKKSRKKALIFSILIIIAIIIFTLILVIPQLIDTLKILVKNLPQTFEICKNWLLEISENNSDMQETIENFNPDFSEVVENAGEFLKNNVGGIIGSSVNQIKNIANVVVNIFLGFIIAIPILSNKEKLGKGLNKFIKKNTKQETYEFIMKIAGMANTKFQIYFAGQFIQACILGVIVFLGMLVLKIPYALTISVMIAVTSLIPMVGPIMGTLIGAILIIAVNPLKALWFIILVLVMQQIQDNILSPRMVGKNLDMPGVLTFLSIMIGGSNFGVVGLLTAVPIVSILYDLYKENIKDVEIEN